MSDDVAVYCIDFSMIFPPPHKRNLFRAIRLIVQHTCVGEYFIILYIVFIRLHKDIASK